MSVKHSKYKNTGLLFELLVKQVAADTLRNQKSPSVKLIQKYFAKGTPLAKEYQLYEYVMRHRECDEDTAETILKTVTEMVGKFDQDAINKAKYRLVKDIKESYEVDNFFSREVVEYKPLAAIYCILESYKGDNVLNTSPIHIVENKRTILNYLTEKRSKNRSEETLLEEYSTYDKDIKILAFKILVEKYNKKYENLTEDQKNLLREYINSGNSLNGIRKVINTEILKLKESVKKYKEKVEDGVLKIKLEEIERGMTPVEKTRRVTEGKVIETLQYYELVEELKKV